MIQSRSVGPAPFSSLYSHGFVRVAAAVPRVRVADPDVQCRANARARRAGASESHAAVVIFPELGLSAYSNEDLFIRRAARRRGRGDRADRARERGARAGDRRRRAAAVRGRAVQLRGRDPPRPGARASCPRAICPSTASTTRSASSARPATLIGDEVQLLGETRAVRRGPDVRVADLSEPSRCTSRSARTSGRRSRRAPTPRWRARPCSPTCRPATSPSARPTTAATLCAVAVRPGRSPPTCTPPPGSGESTTDLAWDGQALIYENGDLLAESERFADDEQMIIADIDLERLVAGPRRARAASATRSATTASGCRAMRRVEFELGVREASGRRCSGEIERFPYVPADPARRNERCEEVYNIQVRGLETRLRATGIEKVVIGVSGGLDSTHALIVAARAWTGSGCRATNMLGLHDARLRHQRAHARQRAPADGGAGRQRRRDRHPARRRRRCSATSATRPPTASRCMTSTFENVQAGERTSHLFRLANHHRALVLGTGDLSRAGARLEHLRRRRPDVALQRQRLGAQDADPVPDPLGDRHRPVRRTRRASVARAGARAPRSRPS